MNNADNKGLCWHSVKNLNVVFIKNENTVKGKKDKPHRKGKYEYVVKRYFGALLLKKQPICQSGFLHECNLRGQGCGKILTDTRTLMYPRPLKQMTQILSESRHLADRALQM